MLLLCDPSNLLFEYSFYPPMSDALFSNYFEDLFDRPTMIKLYRQFVVEPDSQIARDVSDVNGRPLYSNHSHLMHGLEPRVRDGRKDSLYTDKRTNNNCA